MRCSACGSEIEEAARFCGICGTQQEQAVLPKAALRQHPQTIFQGSSALSSSWLEHEGAAAGSSPSPVRTPSPAATPAVGRGARADALAAPARLPTAGAVLNGRFRIRERIGEGGFGTVYRGEQLQMGRECALKVLLPRLADDPQVVGRFRREAKAVSRLKSGHTVQTYDFDETPDGLLYLAMELVEGRSLQGEMEHGPMPVERVLHIVEGIVESLAEAHQLGVVHRDIKPENILLEERPGDPDYVKVLDFGIAKIMVGNASDSQVLTAVGQTLGTVEYMSPEQLMGLELDGRSDLYAVGVLAYEMLAGQLPFSADNRADLITGHLQRRPLPPSRQAPTAAIPASVDALLLRLLEKSPDRRYSSAVELKADLEQVRRSLSARETVDGEVQRRRREARRSSALFVAGLAMLVLALVAALLLWWSVSHAATLPPAVRLLPQEMSAFAALDTAQFREAGPADAVSLILRTLQPFFGRLGAKSSNLGPVVAALAPREHADPGVVLIMDVPVDPALFDRSLGLTISGEHHGIQLRYGAGTACGLLPGDRLLCTQGFPIERVLAMVQGGKVPLVDAAASPLLVAVAAAGGRGPALVLWGRLGARERAEIGASVPVLTQLDQAALALTLGKEGADVKLIGRCLSPAGAKQLDQTLRELIDEAKRHPSVAAFGVRSLVEAVQLDSAEHEVTARLHLSREQYADLMMRLGGIVAALSQGGDHERIVSTGKASVKTRGQKAKKAKRVKPKGTKLPPGASDDRLQR